MDATQSKGRDDSRLGRLIADKDEDGLRQGAPYQPYLQRNEAFPRFPLKITDPDEKAAMNDFIDEIAWAVADEPLVDIRQLDVAAWQQQLNIPDADVTRLLARDDRKRS